MPFRPLPLFVATSMIVGGLGPAGAQPVALPPLAPAGAQPSLAPPPGRVGRIAAVTGAVSFHLADATEWQVARPNLPVTSGTALWVAAAGEAAIGVGGGDRLVLGTTTEFDIDQLGDQALAATQAQGESYLHLRLVAPGETYVVRTPRGSLTIASAGRYEIVSGDTEHPTVITVLDGAATLTGIPETAEIGAGQMLTITGDGAATPFTSSVGLAVQDAFLRHVLAEERPVARRSTAPAIVAQMTGAEALEDVGEWSENAEYGPVWYPPVATYVPYRQGRWAYVAPWGWTWVDDAPWGFAPTHYGRWAEFEGRWGWVPGRDWAPDRPPVYAPALVGFFGGAALGFGRGPAVGWAPLGPRDVYRPPYPVNERAVQVLNQPTGATIQVVNAPSFVNRSAITIVPTQVMTTSAPVAAAIRPGPAPASIGPASVIDFRPGAVPTRQTIGATSAMLRQVNPVGLTAPATHIGQGPSLGQAPAPLPQIGPAALLGGAAAGAVAGGLLRQPIQRNAALPELRPRGTTPPALGATFPGAARPLPPTAPSIAAPIAPRGPGASPGGILGGAPAPGQPDILAGPHPVPLQNPQREPVSGPHREPFAPQRQEAFPARRPELYAAPRPEPYAAPRPEPHFAAPRPLPRQEPVAAPHPIAAPYRPAPPPIQHAAVAPPPPAQHAPPPPHHDGKHDHPER